MATNYRKAIVHSTYPHILNIKIKIEIFKNLSYYVLKRLSMILSEAWM